MSVCIVAQYPWGAITGKPFIGTPGLVVCSDTRATSGDGRTLTWKYRKQGLTARNIMVCFTSSHGAATTLAVKKALGTGSVRRLGKALKEVHEQFGRLTELLAVVWPGQDHPVLLELMPPTYVPKPRSGIVGIGDPAVLNWFKENFGEDPTPEMPPVPSAVVVAALERKFGRVSIPPPSFSIENAAVKVAATLCIAVERAGGPTVGLPLQVMIVQSGHVQSIDIAATEDTKTWQTVTANVEDLKVPAPRPSRLGQQMSARRAVQLFD